MLTKKVPLKIRFLIVWFLLMLPLLVYLTYATSNYEVAEVSNLSMGYMRGDQMALTKVVPTGVNRLFVCGKITIRGSIYLIITLHSIDEKNYYGKDVSSKPFPPGDFCREIMLHEPLTLGFYKIIAIDGHKRVGELVFQVK